MKGKKTNKNREGMKFWFLIAIAVSAGLLVIIFGLLLQFINQYSAADFEQAINSNEFIISNKLAVSSSEQAVDLIPSYFGSVKYDVSQEELDGFDCESFEDNVVWSSNYVGAANGSGLYYVWLPKGDCDTQNEECLLKDLKVKTRFILIDNEFSEQAGFSEGYVKLSNLDGNVCRNPSNGTYQNILVRDGLSFPGKKSGWYGDNGINGIYRYSNCYGMQVFGAQYMVVDVLGLKYNVCKRKLKTEMGVDDESK